MNNDKILELVYSLITAEKIQSHSMPELVVGPVVGEKYLIRTVTMIETGRIVAMDDRWIRLEDAAWIADTGRFSDALKTGELNEVEPYPDGIVAIASIVDIAPWNHPLPRKQL